MLRPLHDVGSDRRKPDHKPGRPAYATIQAPTVTTTTKTASSQPRVRISRPPVANEISHSIAKMTVEPAAMLKGLAEAAYELDAFKPKLTRAGADQRIAMLTAKLKLPPHTL